MKLATIWRVVWPDRGPMFVVVGAIVSLLSDFSAFLSNLADPNLLVWPLVGLAGLLAWFCFGRVGAAKEPPEKTEEAVKCRECDAFRVMLFASAGVALLLIAGQGETATERYGRQLGFIEDTVIDIAEDTNVIRDNLSSTELVRNPRTAADHFRNAWIYNMVRRDAPASWESIQGLYRNHAPNKLDAAELYFNAGRVAVTRDQLLTQMIEIGRSKRDASMLVMAARNVDSNEQASALLDEARAIDPDLPFAYWDPFRTQSLGLVPGGTHQQQYERAQATLRGAETFMEVARRKPVASYYFLPQHAPDMESFVGGQMETYRGSVRNWEQVVQGRGRL